MTTQGIADAAYDDFPEFLRNAQYKEVRRLTISLAFHVSVYKEILCRPDCNITDVNVQYLNDAKRHIDEIVDILQHAHSVTSVTFYGSYISVTREWANQFLSMFTRRKDNSVISKFINVEHLILADSALFDDSYTIELFLNALRDEHCSLKCLSVCSNECIPQSQMNAFFMALRSNNSIKSFEFYPLSSWREDDTFARTVGEKVKVWNEFSFGYVQATNLISSLTEALPYTRSLKYLSLSNGVFGEDAEAVERLTLAVAENHSLHELDLSYNRKVPLSGDGILQILLKHNCLRRLNVTHTPLSRIHCISKFIRNDNTTIEQFICHSNSEEKISANKSKCRENKLYRQRLEVIFWLLPRVRALAVVLPVPSILGLIVDNLQWRVTKESDVPLLSPCECLRLAAFVTRKPSIPIVDRASERYMMQWVFKGTLSNKQ